MKEKEDCICIKQCNFFFLSLSLSLSLLNYVLIVCSLFPLPLITTIHTLSLFVSNKEKIIGRNFSTSQGESMNK